MKNRLLNIIALLFIVFLPACKSVANYPIDDASALNVEDRLVGKWKFREDTNKNNFYAISKAKCSGCDFQYHVKFWNRGGTNPTYEANVYFSKIGNSIFLNVPYWEQHFTNEGYFFLKILETNADYTRITTATVFDTTMRALKSKSEVRGHLEKNLDNPGFYYDTVHFYKVQ